MAENRIRIICGPTAAGKSAVAAGLALEYGAAIVTADSRQIYRGFDIGTAKPDWSERKAIVHEGIDIAEPTERFSAARWSSMALKVIDELLAKGATPLIVGGTGFYLRALVDPLFSSPDVDLRRHAALESVLNPMPLEELRRWCRVVDPSRAHLGRHQLVRALEIAFLTGRRISEMHAEPGATSPLRPHYLMVDPGPGLAARITRRVDAMIAAGWLDEVRALDGRVPEDAPAWKASGYRVMRQVARGALELSVARERIIIETRQYAKRQRTWFRNQLGDAPVTLVNPDDPDAQSLAQRWWKETA